jgi:hypothetical protein
MRRASFVVFALGVALAAPARADAPPSPALPDPGALLGGLVTEAQVHETFDALRNALIAAAEGRDTRIPEALRREIERLDADVRLRGTLAGVMLLKELEARIADYLRKHQPPQPLPDGAFRT